MGTAELRSGILSDVVMMGIRATLGVVFIVHGYGKFSPGFAGFMESFGAPAAMQIPLALGELVPGVLLLIGVLTRISSSLLSIYMLGAIFLIKGAQAFSSREGPSTEFDIILLAAALLVIVMGPGRISLSHIVGRIPRFLH